jgi:uncharacterized protein YbaA (DUF1428 family)
MAEYVDGFVLAVPKRKVQAYRRMAAKAGAVWKEHGALAFRECVADDVKAGKGPSFATERRPEARRGRVLLVHRVPLARRTAIASTRRS